MKTRCNHQLSRRSVLRGVLAGSAVSVGLPFLDGMLNESGTALAAGAPLPVRFGTWFWGLGHTPGHAVDDKSATSHGISFKGECEALARHKDLINFFAKFNTPLDGRSNYPHSSGWISSRTGSAPSKDEEVPTTTYDLLIADQIGTATRFKTIDLTCTGNPSHSYSARGTYTRTAAEISPMAFYAQLFGPDFVDPNKADFTPDPRILVRQSVLSAVGEERRRFMQRLGAQDRSQLDEYFTSIRELDEPYWFRATGTVPTCRTVLEHARLAQDADLSHPVILSSDGGVMDGMHRVGKALLLGREDVAAVRFATDPDPDFRNVGPDELPY